MSITCNSKFESHIKESILQPFEKLDNTFHYFIDEKRSTTKNSTLEVYIFCNNEEVFTDACKLLEMLKPGTRKYLLPEDAEEVVVGMQCKLENDYYIRVVYRKPSLLLHGLISSNLDQCYAELKSKIDVTVLSTELIPISSYRQKLLKNLYKEEVLELEKQCSHIICTRKFHIIERNNKTG